MGLTKVMSKSQNFIKLIESSYSWDYAGLYARSGISISTLKQLYEYIHQGRKIFSNKAIGELKHYSLQHVTTLYKGIVGKININSSLSWTTDKEVALEFVEDTEHYVLLSREFKPCETIVDLVFLANKFGINDRAISEEKEVIAKDRRSVFTSNIILKK